MPELSVVVTPPGTAIREGAPQRIASRKHLSTIRTYLGRTRRYLRRLQIWRQVGRELRGLTPADDVILRRAVRNGFKDAFKTIDEWRDPMVDQDCQVVGELGTFSVRACSDDLWHVLPSRERAVLEAIRQNLSGPDCCFVDAGANIGGYSQFAARHCHNVIAIEMMPDTAAILRSHVPDNVTVVEKALSDKVGEVIRASVKPGKFGQARISDGGALEIPTTTLEQVLRDIPRVKLLKMDLEGAELAALRGTPTDKVDAIIFEDWGDSAVSTWLRQTGYDVSRLDRNNSLARRKAA